MKSGLWAIAIGLCVQKSAQIDRDAIVIGIFILLAFMVTDAVDWIRTLK